MIEEYKKYLIEKSSEVRSNSDALWAQIYSHSGIINMLENPGSYGYYGTSEDINLLLIKARTIIMTWSKDSVDTYEEFIARNRDTKLTEIGI